MQSCIVAIIHMDVFNVKVRSELDSDCWVDVVLPLMFVLNEIEGNLIGRNLDLDLSLSLLCWFLETSSGTSDFKS